MGKITKVVEKALDIILIANLIFWGQYYLINKIKNLPLKNKDIYGLCVNNPVTNPYSVDEFSKNTDLGLENSVWRFSSPDKLVDVTLVGMTHYADKQFYSQVLSILTSSDYVLMEGVDIRNSKYENHPFYKFALNATSISVNSLASQKEDIDTVLFENKVVYADATIDEIIEFDNTFSSRWFWSNQNALFWIAKKVYDIYTPSPELVSEVLERGTDNVTYSSYVLLCPRDDILMENFEGIYTKAKILGQHTEISIPWGQMHIPDLVRRLTDQEFTLEEHYYLTSISSGTK